MPIVRTPESRPEIKYPMFEGIEKLPTHQKILHVLYVFGEALTGRKIKIKPKSNGNHKAPGADR